MPAFRVLLLASSLLVGHSALAQTSGGSPGCADLSQAAAAGVAARLEADEENIPPPQSVMSMTCLDGLFNGVGLNVLTDIFEPEKLLTSIATKALLQACTAARAAWDSAKGSIQCGLTVSGWNLGFGGLGGGTFCPRLSFGGGGPALGSASLGSGASNGFYLNGQPTLPVGYGQTRPYGFQQ